MPVRNPAWYNSNESRPYPLADSGDLLSVQGQRLPHNIITDINLRYPNDLGEYPYLAAVAVTENIVSLTIQAAASLTDTSSLAPVAALGVPRPIIEGRPYALESQYPGAGGWVVFGSGIDENFSGRFLGPQRTPLSPRVARGYRTLPVTSMGKLNALQALTGLVKLSGRSPLEIVKEEREVQGVNQDVIVVRLIQPDTPDGVNNETTVFRQFLGLCSGRPESKTCGDPNPVEFINTVRPDCNGNITIEFQGCAKLAEILVQGGGVILDCELGLIDACAGDTLPDATGKLRTDYPDECLSESLWVDNVDLNGEQIVDASQTADPEFETFVGSLPHYDCFAYTAAEMWNTVSGTFQLVDGTSPDSVCNQYAFSESASDGLDFSYESTDLARRNIALWQGFDDSSLNRRYAMDFLMSTGTSGSKRNAGMVLNYRDHPTVPGRYQYFLVELDHDSGELQIKRWNGSNLVIEPAFASLPGLSLGKWYRLVVETTPVGGSAVNIAATLTNVDAPAVSASLNLATSNYLPDTGYFGLHANRSQTRFSSISVEDIS